MVSRRQVIDVPVSISDWLGEGPEVFWEAARDRISAWLVKAIQAALEHEIQQFAGAGWHERNPGSRKTSRCGYRPRRFLALDQEAAAIHDVDTAAEARERLGIFASAWRDREPKAVASLEADFEQTLLFLAVPKAHRSWVTTTNPLERFIRELRRRLRPMGTFQGFVSCRCLIYVALWKLSDQRRNAIPYSLWPSQPWYGRSHRKKRRGRGCLEGLEEAFWQEFVVS